MTNLTNYHSHCLYCDGRANMEDFIRFAISEGFTSPSCWIRTAGCLSAMPRCRFLPHGLWNGTEWKITFPNLPVSKKSLQIK